MSIKMKYNLLYLLYCIAGCCIGGFIAVFLQFKGVSNTMIGLVTGIGCVLSIFLSSSFTGVVKKIKGMNYRNMLAYLLVFMGVLFVACCYGPAVIFKPAVIMVLYIIIYCTMICIGPFFQIIASDYINEGKDVNFGLARGLGSAAWACSSLVFGVIVDYLNPNILGLGYVVFIALTLFDLLSMPVSEVKQAEGSKKEGTILSVSKKYKVYFFLLLGWSFLFAGSTSLGTYLINIVNSLGGSTSLYGTAAFLSALSEMPIMAITPKLMKRFKASSLLLFAAICYGLRALVICLAPNMIVLCCGMMLQGVSYGLFCAVITYYVIYNLKTEDQVVGQTMIVIFSSGFGSTIGNIIGGYLVDTFGLGFMYKFVGVLSVVGIIVMIFAKLIDLKTEKKELIA